MKRILLIIAFIFAIALTASAQSNPPLTITETDGSPSKTNASKLVFPAGTLSISGGIVTYTAAGAGTVTSVSVVAANGLSGTVATATTTPAITLNISALDAVKIANGSVDSTEFQYLDGVTSAIQTQLTARPTGSGTANSLPQWLTSTTLGDSPATYDGALFSIVTDQLSIGNGTSHGTIIALDDTARTITLTATNGALLPTVTKVAGLTAGRVTFAGTGGLLSDDADMTFATDTLTVTKLVGSTSVTIGPGSAITSSGAGGALNTGAFVADALNAHLAGTETFTGAKTFGSQLLIATSPKITTGIQDANGNSMIAFSPTASAVDGLTFTNSATGNPGNVRIDATGSDSNVSLAIFARGSGGKITFGNDATRLTITNGDASFAVPIEANSGADINGFFRIRNGNLLAFDTGLGNGDLTISRNAAGIVQFGTTAANALGSWLATNGTLSGTFSVTGVSTLGSGTSFKNIRHGISGAMVLGTVTVTDTGCTANTRYFFSAHTLGTISIPGGYYASTRNAGTSFVITSSQATETSTIDWVAVEP